MDPEQPYHGHAQSRDTNADFRGAHGVIMQVEASKLLPWLMLISILSGIAVALAIMTLIVYSQNYRELERENRLMQQKYDDMKVEFLSRGMNPNPHMPGESK